MKKIFIITCNAKQESLKAPYVEAYIEESLNAGNEVRSINVYDLDINYFNFNNNNPDFSLTEELKQSQDNIVWADQIVFVYPIWWFAMPAKMKSFIERVFQKDVVTRMGKFGPEGLLKGKTAVIIQSYDMPDFAMKYLYGDTPVKYMKMVLTTWCGLKIEKRFDFAGISGASDKTKQKWIKDIRKFASSER